MDWEWGERDSWLESGFGQRWECSGDAHLNKLKCRSGLQKAGSKVVSFASQWAVQGHQCNGQEFRQKNLWSSPVVRFGIDVQERRGNQAKGRRGDPNGSLWVADFHLKKEMKK